MRTVPKQSPTRSAAQHQKRAGKVAAVTQTIETDGKVIAKRVTHVVMTGATVGSKRRPQTSTAKMRRPVAKNPSPQEWFDEESAVK